MAHKVWKKNVVNFSVRKTKCIPWYATFLEPPVFRAKTGRGGIYSATLQAGKNEQSTSEIDNIVNKTGWYASVRLQRYEACWKVGEHKGGVSVVRGVAETALASWLGQKWQRNVSK